MLSSLHTRTAAFAAVLLALSATAAAHVAPDSCGLPDSATPASYLATNHDSEEVNIRAQPNTRAAILAVCDNQGEAAILGKSGAWYRVRLALPLIHIRRCRRYGGGRSRATAGPHQTQAMR